MAWYFGARFDLAFKSLASGNFRPGAEVYAEEMAKSASSSAAAAATSAIEAARDEL